MANVREVIIPRDKRMDGTWNVKIRVTHQRKTSFISTLCYVTERHIRKDYTIKDPAILKAINPILDDFRTKIMELGPKLDIYSLPRLLKHLQGQIKSADRVNVIEFGRKRIGELKAAKRDGSAGNMTTVVNSLIDFFCSEDVPGSEIRAKMLADYEKFLTSPRKITRLDQFQNPYDRTVDGLSNNGLHNHMRDLRILFNEIKDFYNDEDLEIIVVKHYPFKKYKLVNKIDHNKPKLNVKQIKSIWDCEVEAGSRVELARDLFMLSFYLCGMNAVDLYQLPSHENNLPKRIDYNRSKTRSRRRDSAFISINIPDIAVPLYLKYVGALQSRYASHNGLDRALSFGMRKIGQLTGISDLEFYDARHAVGDWARNICRYSKDDVGLVLNHKDQSTSVTDTYISKNWDIIDEVQESVIKLIPLFSEKFAEQNNNVIKN